VPDIVITVIRAPDDGEITYVLLMMGK